MMWWRIRKGNEKLRNRHEPESGENAAEQLHDGTDGDGGAVRGSRYDVPVSLPGAA